MHREHVLDRHSRGQLDFRIRVDKGQVKGCGKAAAYRGFSGPHHADKNDAAFLKREAHGPRQRSAAAAIVLRRHSFALQAGKDHDSSTYADMRSLTTGAKNGSPLAKEPAWRLSCRHFCNF